MPFGSTQDHNEVQSGGGRELREEVVYRILHSLRYPITATAITFLAVLSVVVSLTGPTETGEIVEASNADPVNHPTVQSGITDHEHQIPEFEKPATIDVLDLTKIQTQYRETLRLEAISGTVYTPNFVPGGSLMDSITSFTPVQQQPVISQPTNPGSGQPIQSPPSEPGAPPATYIPAVEQWRSTVTTAILNYGGPASDTDRFLRIMHCESRGQPNATNASSGAAGLMQHMPQYWDQRAISAGYAGSSPYDPTANINVSAWLIYQASGGGWQHWVCQ